MVGITLSAEQIRSAPPEVRRWLEKEVLVFVWLASACCRGEFGAAD